MSPVSEFSLNDQVAIVTGAGRGIGAATAHCLARAGAHLVINDINPEAAQALCSEIEKFGRKTLLSTHDVSNYEQAHHLIEETKKKFSRVDILVNNAGITRDAMLHKLTEEKWDEVIRVNLKGPFNVGQAAAKVMMEQKSGKIINIASIAYLGNVGQTNYSASKAGVVGMTRTWSAELSRYGINVNAIAPGFIDSVLTQQIPEEIKEKFVKRIPLRRIGEPNEIGNLVRFLASSEASYITGQCFHVDGGLTGAIL